MIQKMLNFDGTFHEVHRERDTVADALYTGMREG